MSGSAVVDGATDAAESEGADSRTAYLTAATQQPRARRAADVTTVVIGVLLVLGSIAARSYSQDAFQQSISDFAAALPSWAVALLLLTFSAGLVFAIAVILLLAFRRRWKALRDVVLAAAVAAGVTLALVAVYGDLWPPVMPEFQGGGHDQFPVMRVSVVTAVVVSSTPYLARPLRRLGWLFILLGAMASVTLAYGVPAAALGAIGVGMAAAGAVLLVFGSPLGFPDTAEVGFAMERIGIDVPDLRISTDQSWGVRRLLGTTTGGEPVEVKAYGRDATDSQVMAKAWHSLMYRQGSRRITFSRLQSVEHEALVTMLAEQGGVSVPRVLAAASATDEVAVLVTTNPGTRLADLDAEHVDDATLTGVWADVAQLHDLGITHGRLGTGAVRILESDVTSPGDTSPADASPGHLLTEFASGSVVFRDSDAALDVVHLLFGSAALVGVERAVAAAREGLGSEKLASALGYLQPPALSSRERRSVDKASKFLGQLRAEVARVTSTEMPEPVKLRRLGIRDILTVVVLLLFVSAIIPVLAGVDYATIGAELQTATWWMIIAAVLLGQVAFVPQALAMTFAVGRSIPLRPMAILQPAITFISFAVPGMAGRVAMESAFLFKYGVSPAESITKGGIDAFGGFLTQLLLLGLALVTGAITLPTGSSSSGSSSSGSSLSVWVLVIVLALVAATIIAIWKVPKLNDRVVPEIGKSWGALREVLSSPSRAIGLLGSNLVVQLVWGLALWLALTSLGTHLSLISCTAVVVGTSLLQGLVPVPGGIGVSEAVIVALLAPLGVSSEIAMVAAVIWRVSTFYLPAAEGFVAARWLEKHGYL